MALQKTVEFRGITVPSSYIRVAFATATKSQINYVLTYHKDSGAEAFQESMHCADHDLSGENVIRQAYQHAVNLPEMLGAVEC